MAQSIEQLKASIRGQLIQQDDSGYDAARRVYNGMIDKRPKLIVRAVDVGDVMAAVRYGRENGLLTAIRGGGHNGAGLGTCDGGRVIDLSPMKGVRVDPVARTVRPRRDASGATWTMRPMLPGWLRRAVSSQRPESLDSLWEEASAT